MKSSHSIRIATLTAAAALFLAGAPRVWAIPSFARQTGLPCSRCHTTFPELTEFGREFKLNGYTLSGKHRKKITAPSAKNKSGLWINNNLPISVMFQLADTLVAKTQPGTQNGSVEFPQQMSLFLAGEVTPHLGTFLQVTYSGADDHFSMDNSDIRYVGYGTLAGKQTVYGLDFNNNPTVEDLWNDTPAWGWPFVSPDSSPTPIAAPILDGGLAQDVGGAGGYMMWDHHWYGDVTLYRSMHLGGPQPPDGIGFGTNIAGVAPYWRGAYQTTWSGGLNYLEVGTFGMHLSSFPGAIAGPEDHFTDTAADFQYERRLGINSLSVHGAYVHQSASLGGLLAAGEASQLANTLSNLQANAIYHFGDRYSLGAGFFRDYGSRDPVLYAPGPVTGSASGSPDSGGYLLQAGFWPAQNVELSILYQGFTTFNGASQNYDGAGRNAGQNNTVYTNLWLMF